MVRWTIGRLAGVICCAAFAATGCGVGDSSSVSTATANEGSAAATVTRPAPLSPPASPPAGPEWCWHGELLPNPIEGTGAEYVDGSWQLGLRFSNVTEQSCVHPTRWVLYVNGIHGASLGTLEEDIVCPAQCPSVLTPGQTFDVEVAWPGDRESTAVQRGEDVEFRVGIGDHHHHFLMWFIRPYEPELPPGYGYVTGVVRKDIGYPGTVAPELPAEVTLRAEDGEEFRAEATPELGFSLIAPAGSYTAWAESDVFEGGVRCAVDGGEFVVPEGSEVGVVFWCPT